MIKLMKDTIAIEDIVKLTGIFVFVGTCIQGGLALISWVY